MIHFNGNVVLASQSPRRQELIKLIFENVRVLPADCDETLPEGMGAKTAVEYLSKIKNSASAKAAGKDSLVISADTVVSVDDIILGKPVDKSDARRMVTLLSGRTHQVYTGVTISRNGKSVTFSEKTDVEFYSLTNAEIEEYINSPEPYDKAYVPIWNTDKIKYEWADKAGGYAIQGTFAKHIKGINGDYYNVVGLPISRLYRELKKFI